MRCTLVSAILLLTLGTARADIDLKLSGHISSDIRFRVLSDERPPPTPEPTQWTLLKNGVSRNENRIRAALSLKIGEKIRGVADVEMVTFGFSDLKDIDSSTLRARDDPYYFEFHAAYIDISNLFPHFDLRIGRQVVPWGAADKFNPISNINTLDLSDALMFGRALANNMIRADWNPIGDLNFQAVLIPVFRPAQLPRTAPLALLDSLRPAPVANQGVRAALDQERSLYVPLRDPVTGMLVPAAGTLTVTADVLQPEITAANMQIALRTTWKLFEQDFGISYYRGRFGIPVPAWSFSSGQLLKNVTETWLVYPRMDVLGVEMAGSIQKLGGLGYWIEAAVIFPGEVTFAFYDYITAATSTDPNVPKPFEYLPDPNTGRYIRYIRQPGTVVNRPVVVESTPFVKATIGADYTIAGKLYINLQYVHGFIDEFGAGRAARPRRDATNLDENPRVESRIGDYLVGGLDLHLLQQRLLLRMFGVIKLPSIDLESKTWDDYTVTGVLFPQIAYKVFDATELMAGAFIMLGDRSTKFGDPAAGGSEIFIKAKVSF